MCRTMNSWQSPPASAQLDDREIHIWRAVLGARSGCIECLRLTLTSDELARANSFHFPADRDRFILSRGLLRTLLALYTGIRPAQLRFHQSPYGKPALATGTVEQRLRFNVSHTTGLVLFAVNRVREVGIDVEYVRQDLEWEQISRGFFHPRENDFLHSLRREVQGQAFFRLWTHKEAYAKARGLGLAIPLDRLDLSPLIEEPTLLLLADNELPGNTSWSLQELVPKDGYVAALAVEGDIRDLTCRQYCVELEAVCRSCPYPDSGSTPRLCQ